MFIIRYVWTSLSSFTKTLQLRKEKGWKIVIYFFFLTLLMAFPLNYAIVRENGWNLNFIAPRLQENIPNWYPYDLPSDCTVSASGFSCITTTDTVVLNEGVIAFVLNGTLADQVMGKPSLILMSEKLYYVDSEGHYLETDYRGFQRSISFQELRANAPEDTIEEFAVAIEDSFGAYLIIFSVITNIWVTFLLNIIYLFLFSALVIIFKIGYQHFMSFREAMKLSVIAMTIPALVAFMLGFFVSGAFAFSSVITAFGIPLIMILLIKIPGKKEFQSRL